MEGKSHVFGKHYIVEFMGCSAQSLRRVDDLKPLFLEAIRLSGATVLASHFYQFEPQGVTGMSFIAESHFSIHTWPEDGYAAFDVMTCGPIDPEKSIQYLQVSLGSTKVDVQILERGLS